ncbi:MAG: hypothetical protein ABIN94_19300 [Ferruginibacter sp.]
MKFFSRPAILISLFLLSLSFTPQAVLAQPGNPDDPGEDPDTPVDNGVYVLLAAGLVYGIKTAILHKQKKV